MTPPDAAEGDGISKMSQHGCATQDNQDIYANPKLGCGTGTGGTVPD